MAEEGHKSEILQQFEDIAAQLETLVHETEEIDDEEPKLQTTTELFNLELRPETTKEQSLEEIPSTKQSDDSEKPPELPPDFVEDEVMETKDEVTSEENENKQTENFEVLSENHASDENNVVAETKGEIPTESENKHNENVEVPSVNLASDQVNVEAQDKKADKLTSNDTETKHTENFEQPANRDQVDQDSDAKHPEEAVTEGTPISTLKRDLSLNLQEVQSEAHSDTSTENTESTEHTDTSELNNEDEVIFTKIQELPPLQRLRIRNTMTERDVIRTQVKILEEKLEYLENVSTEEGKVETEQIRDELVEKLDNLCAQIEETVHHALEEHVGQIPDKIEQAYSEHDSPGKSQWTFSRKQSSSGLGWGVENGTRSLSVSAERLPSPRLDREAERSKFLSKSQFYGSSSNLLSSSSGNLNISPNNKTLTRSAINTVSFDDEEEEESEDIVLIVDAKTKEVEVKGGTLLKLVERLTWHKQPDVTYANAFLLTYRSFTDPATLFGLLEMRYNISIENETKPMEPEKWAAKKRIIQLRVTNVLRIWMERYWYDFSSNPELLKKLNDFIHGPLSTEFETFAGTLKKLLSTDRPSGPSELIFLTDKSLTVKTKTIMDFEAAEVARQVALIESEYYRNISTSEFLNQSWSKKNRNEIAPGIVSMIKRFNVVSTWVCTEVVKQEQLKKRTRMIKHFLKIAQESLLIGNFNGVMEILAGLQNSAIYRLKKTWEKLEKSRYYPVYQELMDVMSSDGNYKNYRKKLHSKAPPAVPYLGVYLTDLTFIEEGNKNELGVRPDMINFDKRRKIAMVIREIQHYQYAFTGIQEEPTIRSYLLNTEFLTEKALYKYSLICEPRGGRQPANQSFSSKFLLKKLGFDTFE